MRALLTVGHGDRDQLMLDVDFPEPRAGEGEVVVQVAATALNFHDIFTRRGMPGIRIPLPIVTGSDIAGTVARIGPGVTGWSEGDRVLIDPIRHGDPAWGMIGETRHGGRAERVSVPAAHLIRVPDTVSLEAAAALPLAYGTAHRMLVGRGRIRAGESILVLGASGGVGVACVQLAKLYGLSVIACVSSDIKGARLRALGVDHVVNYRATGFRDAVRSVCGKPRLTGAGGVDVAVNFSGGDTFVDTQKCVARGGRILSCGATAGHEVAMDMRYLFSFEHTVIGSDGWERTDLATLLGLTAEGRLFPVIDGTLPLAEAAEAERRLEAREVVGKLLLRP